MFVAAGSVLVSDSTRNGAAFIGRLILLEFTLTREANDFFFVQWILASAGLGLKLRFYHHVTTDCLDDIGSRHFALYPYSYAPRSTIVRNWCPKIPSASAASK